MNNDKEIMAFGVTGQAFDVLKFEFPHFVKQFMEVGFRARYLANHDSKRLLSALPQKRVQIKYLPKQYESDVTTIIYGDKIAIQSLTGDNIYVIVIKDKALCAGYKAYFEFMWSILD
jgi:hypothetical protein